MVTIHDTWRLQKTKALATKAAATDKAENPL
jgi:hypothetical protein